MGQFSLGFHRNCQESAVCVAIRNTPCMLMYTRTATLTFGCARRTQKSCVKMGFRALTNVMLWRTPMWSLTARSLFQRDTKHLQMYGLMCSSICKTTALSTSPISIPVRKGLLLPWLLMPVPAATRRWVSTVTPDYHLANVNMIKNQARQKVEQSLFMNCISEPCIPHTFSTF